MNKEISIDWLLKIGKGKKDIANIAIFFLFFDISGLAIFVIFLHPLLIYYKNFKKARGKMNFFDGYSYEYKFIPNSFLKRR